MATTLLPSTAVLATALLLQGCAGGLGMTLLGVGASTGATTGISHTINGIATKTFTVPSDDLRAATLAALGTMDMPVEADILVADETQEATVRQITAAASDRDIDIEIEEVTPRTSRLRVVASKNLLFKDSATATEIILQTERALAALQDARARAAARKGAKTTVRARKAAR
ncbi:MAG: hypothetical protein AB1918_18820 [Pseudomonadota bacterium]